MKLINEFIDGSRFTLYNEQGKYECEDSDIGCYLDYPYNAIYLNPKNLIIEMYRNVEEDFLKLICAGISHEFLHMLLLFDHSIIACDRLDRLCNNYDDAFTECGGI